MPFRTPRYLTAREVPADNARLLFNVPIGPGESLSGFRAQIEARSLPLRRKSDSTISATNFAFNGSATFLEWNLYALFVPFNIINTYSHSADQNGHLTAPPQAPRTTQDWDFAWERLTYEFGTDDNEYYGASITTKAAYDPVRNAYIRDYGANTKDATSDPTNASDEPLSEPSAGLPGPMGIVRLYSHEAILRAMGVESIAAGIPVISKLLSAGGLNDFNFADNLDISEDGHDLVGPGHLLVGAVRYNTAVTNEWDASYSNADSNDATTLGYQRSRNLALAKFWGNAQAQVRAGITLGNSDEDDILRSILFGGGMFDEGLQFDYGPIGANSAWIRENDLAVAGKLTATIATPYQVGNP